MAVESKKVSSRKVTPGAVSPWASLKVVLGILGMIVVPTGLTLHTAKVAPIIPVAAWPAGLTPFGYTISLLLFLVPIAVIGLWILPKDGVRVSKRSFLWTIGLMFPLGGLLDFLFAHRFFLFPNAGATLQIKAPAIGGGVFHSCAIEAGGAVSCWGDGYLGNGSVTGSTTPVAVVDLP